jgi:hypothetical protein
MRNLLLDLPALSLELEDEYTLFTLSQEFLSAAKILYNTNQIELNHNSVAYYLAGHSAELALKSYLFKKGESIEDLAKRFGHDLQLLIKIARLNELPSYCETGNIMKLGNIYKKKRLEYRLNNKLIFPPLDLLIEEVDCLNSYMFENMFKYNK